jgi:hypothetical protein
LIWKTFEYLLFGWNLFVVYWESPIGKGLISSDPILVEGMLFERLNVECWSGRLCRACFMVKFWFEKEVRSMQKFLGCEQQLEKLDTLWRRDYSSFVWVESGDGKTFARNPLSVARQLNTVYLRYIMSRREAIRNVFFNCVSIDRLSGWETIMGLQFENLVLNNISMLASEVGLTEKMLSP